MAGSRLSLWVFGLVALLALLVVGRLHPLAHLLLGTWVPLPLILVGWRLGAGAAALLALAGVAVLGVLYPPGVIFLELLGPGFPLLLGLFLALSSRRGWPWGTAIMVTVVALGVVSLGLFLGQAYFHNLPLRAFWAEKSTEVARLAVQLLEGSGISPPDLQVLGLPLGDFQELISQVLPALTLINLGLTAWLNVLVARLLLGSRGGEAPGEPLSRWASPEWLVFVFLAAGFGLLSPWSALRLLGLNLLLMGALLYFFQGLAVIAHLCQRFQVPVVLRGVGYILAFLNPIILLVIILGLLDLWVDFRGLQSPRQA